MRLLTLTALLKLLAMTFFRPYRFAKVFGGISAVELGVRAEKKTRSLSFKCVWSVSSIRVGIRIFLRRQSTVISMFLRTIHVGTFS